MWKKAETLIPILFFVDILSRKAWAYVLTKSKEEKRSEVSAKTIQGVKYEVGLIRGLEGDDGFSRAPIRKFCEDNDIRLDTSVAKEEHISNGNKIGIIDRSGRYGGACFGVVVSASAVFFLLCTTPCKS